MDPGGEPAADVASARHGREVIELIQQLQAGEGLQDPQPKGGAADAAAREAEPRAFRVSGVDVPTEFVEKLFVSRSGGIVLGEYLHGVVIREGAIQQFGFFCKNFSESEVLALLHGGKLRPLRLLTLMESKACAAHAQSGRQKALRRSLPPLRAGLIELDTGCIATDTRGLMPPVALHELIGVGQ